MISVVRCHKEVPPIHAHTQEYSSIVSGKRFHWIGLGFREEDMRGSIKIRYNGTMLLSLVFLQFSHYSLTGSSTSSLTRSLTSSVMWVFTLTLMRATLCVRTQCVAMLFCSSSTRIYTLCYAHASQCHSVASGERLQLWNCATKQQKPVFCSPYGT